MDSAAEQVMNEKSKEAVELRDQGKPEEAKELLKGSFDMLVEDLESSGAAASPRLEKLEREVQKDADEMDDNRNWKKKRKSMRQRQFKYDNQQKY
jgi:Ca-activated chloride channel family protein